MVEKRIQHIKYNFLKKKAKENKQILSTIIKKNLFKYKREDLKLYVERLHQISENI